MSEAISPDQQTPKLSPEAVKNLKRDLSIDYIDDVGDMGAAQNVCGYLGLKMTREYSDNTLKSSPDAFIIEAASHAIYYYEVLEKALTLPDDQWPDSSYGATPEAYAEALTRISSKED